MSLYELSDDSDNEDWGLCTRPSDKQKCLDAAIFGYLLRCKEPVLTEEEIRERVKSWYKEKYES